MHGFAFECYYGGKFFARADKQKRHTENCISVPGIICNFNKKNLITFEDNFKSKGDIPVAIYFEFEKTAPINNCFDPEPKKMFVMSYVLIATFHPHLNLKKIIVQRSYGHSLEQLTTINYLTNDQMSFIDVTLIKQLNDIAEEVGGRKCKNALGQMFTIETALIKKDIGKVKTSVVYQKFIKVCISLLALLGSHINKDEDQFDTNLRDVLEEKYPETDLEKLRSKIDRAEIKNIIRNTNGNKIPRFNLKLYAFVYGAMIDFPPSNFMYDTITTNNFFKNVHYLIEVKVHLHHSDITGNILGYAHDFFNWNVRENKSEIALIAHNLFGFDMLFFIEGYRATAWGTKDLNFGGENLTRIN